ncbi:putative transcription factor bHLH family [Lupinus albus]|uniref:Putative transcription factor bHLH family n=1 Tax=Lupinus albus TaxID=3870 RepID=A0A6A4R3W2_LUPAL|nr:putative transcription factor bHLH family [Lupinus albus]
MIFIMNIVINSVFSYIYDFFFTRKTLENNIYHIALRLKLRTLLPHLQNISEVRDSGAVVKKSESGPPPKRHRIETPLPLPAFKVRKEKMGDRITTLQQLVTPFGKTDTASVLSEATEYIKYLHEQVTVLSTPYMKGGIPTQHQQVL